MMKASFLKFVFFFSLFILTISMAAALSVPKEISLGFAFVVGMILVFQSKRLIRKVTERASNRLSARAPMQPKPARVVTTAERVFSAALMTAICAVLLVMTYTLHWDSKWYGIAIACWMAGVAISWLVNRPPAGKSTDG